jgi:hypothetical protein
MSSRQRNRRRAASARKPVVYPCPWRHPSNGYASRPAEPQPDAAGGASVIARVSGVRSLCIAQQQHCFSQTELMHAWIDSEHLTRC